MVLEPQRVTTVVLRGPQRRSRKHSFKKFIALLLQKQPVECGAVQAGCAVSFEFQTMGARHQGSVVFAAWWYR